MLFWLGVAKTAPTMHIIRKIARNKNSGIERKLQLIWLILCQFLRRSSIVPIVIMAFKIISKGIVESGWEIPSNKLNSFNTNPPKAKNAMLSPIEKSIVSTLLISLNFNNLMKMKPGTKLK